MRISEHALQGQSWPAIVAQEEIEGDEADLRAKLFAAHEAARAAVLAWQKAACEVHTASAVQSMDMEAINATVDDFLSFSHDEMPDPEAWIEAARERARA